MPVHLAVLFHQMISQKSRIRESCITLSAFVWLVLAYKGGVAVSDVTAFVLIVHRLTVSDHVFLQVVSL